MWVGLLYYFNFVQIPNMTRIPDAQKPAIGKVIAPAALWWFRWAAMATIATGRILARLNGYILEAIPLGLIDAVAQPRTIALGLGPGAKIWFIGWLVMWPGNQPPLCLVEDRPHSK